jgi:hypothetical protein
LIFFQGLKHGGHIFDKHVGLNIVGGAENESAAEKIRNLLLRKNA